MKFMWLIIFIPSIAYYIWPYSIEYRYFPTPFGIGKEPVGLINTFLNVGYIQHLILKAIIKFIIATGLFLWTLVQSLSKG